jgi:hypothetical protein
MACQITRSAGHVILQNANYLVARMASARLTPCGRCIKHPTMRSLAVRDGGRADLCSETMLTGRTAAIGSRRSPLFRLPAASLIPLYHLAALAVRPPTLGISRDPAAIRCTMVWSHSGHSNDLISNPGLPCVMRASVVFVQHLEQRGRSIAESETRGGSLGRDT